MYCLISKLSHLKIMLIAFLQHSKFSISLPQKIPHSYFMLFYFLRICVSDDFFLRRFPFFDLNKFMLICGCVFFLNTEQLFLQPGFFYHTDFLLPLFKGSYFIFHLLNLYL